MWLIDFSDDYTQGWLRGRSVKKGTFKEDLRFIDLAWECI